MNGKDKLNLVLAWSWSAACSVLWVVLCQTMDLQHGELPWDFIAVSLAVTAAVSYVPVLTIRTSTKVIAGATLGAIALQLARFATGRADVFIGPTALLFDLGFLTWCAWLVARRMGFARGQQTHHDCLPYNRT